MVPVSLFFSWLRYAVHFLPFLTVLKKGVEVLDQVRHCSPFGLLDTKGKLSLEFGMKELTPPYVSHVIGRLVP